MEKSPSSNDSIRASCQLLAKDWTFNTGKLPSGGLPRKTDHPDMTSAVTLSIKHQNKKTIWRKVTPGNLKCKHAYFIIKVLQACIIPRHEKLIQYINQFTMIWWSNSSFTKIDGPKSMQNLLGEKRLPLNKRSMYINA